MFFFTLLLPILFGFMGLGFDVSMLYVNKGKLQDVADAAALAGAFFAAGFAAAGLAVVLFLGAAAALGAAFWAVVLVSAMMFPFLRVAGWYRANHMQTILVWQPLNQAESP